MTNGKKEWFYYNSIKYSTAGEYTDCTSAEGKTTLQRFDGECRVPFYNYYSKVDYPE